jgi:hypothetical protein
MQSVDHVGGQGEDHVHADLGYAVGLIREAKERIT